MNTCKCCGKEIPEYRNFCGRSCSARYSNLRRVRRPWTEEQKRQVYKKKYGVECRKFYCKYCGVEIDKGKVCSNCKPYVQKVPTFEHAGIYEGPLEFRYNLLCTKVKTLHQAGCCITEICKKLNIHDVTVRTILHELGLQLYSLSEVQVRMYTEGFRDISPSRGQYKSCFHTSWEGSKYYLRSSYELEYAQQLDDLKIPYKVECFRIRYFDSKLNRVRVAIPDFYLPCENTIVEIKSKWTFDKQNMEDKFKAYRECGYFAKLILDKKEVNLY